MISFTIVPPDKQIPHSSLGRCPTLTHYKLLCGFLVFAFSLLYAFTTLVRNDRFGVKDNTGAVSFCSLVLKEAMARRNISGDINSDVLGRYDSRVRLTDNFSLASGSTQTARRDMKKRLPSAIVIGARKAGTRALLRFINLHPHVVTSRQETHFFDRYYDQGFDWYRRQMPFSFEGQVTIEKTPNYFVDWEVPERVYNLNSSIRLVLVVRNPIDRAISDYVQLKEKFYKNGREEYFGSFEELALDVHTGRINKSYAPIKRSLYCRHLEKWLNFFKLPQLLVVDGENLKVSPWEELYKLEDFLGLSHKISRDHFVYNKTKGFYCIKVERRRTLGRDDQQFAGFLQRSEQCLTDSKGRNHPVLDPNVRRELWKFFKPFNIRFFMRIGRAFDWR